MLMVKLVPFAGVATLQERTVLLRSSAGSSPGAVAVPQENMTASGTAEESVKLRWQSREETWQALGKTLVTEK